MADLYIFTAKRVVAEVFSCEFCDIFKDTFFIEYLWCIPASASGNVFSSAVFLLALWISWLFLIDDFLFTLFQQKNEIIKGLPKWSFFEWCVWREGYTNFKRNLTDSNLIQGNFGVAVFMVRSISLGKGFWVGEHLASSS